MQRSGSPRAARIRPGDQAAQPLIHAQFEIEIADERQIELSTGNRPATVAAQIRAPLLKRSRGRAVVTLGSEEGMSAADAIIKRLGEGARVDPPVHDVE